MRVLTIFIDMIRANRLSIFNDDIKINTPLDNVFKNLGGTIYTNCFSPGPDTPRGIATYMTGIEPWKNGCNTRLKWPGPFLKQDLKTVYDLFLDKNYTIDLFASQNEIKIGFFTEHINKLKVVNNDHDIEKYLSDIKLKNNHFIFIGVPDYHWAFDDLGHTLRGEKKSYEITKKTLDIIFTKLNKDDFDHIFIFSDHGFKFSYEIRKYPREFLLNEDRTNILMLHRKKGQNGIKKNNKLCSLADMYATYCDILNLQSDRGISLFSKKERKFVIAEDHLNFLPSVNQNIELWSLIKKDNIYIRTLEKAMLIDRKTKKVINQIIEEYDEILKQNSSFGTYWDEYEKIFKYIKNIKLDKNKYYLSNIKRVKRNKILKLFDSVIDFISSKDT